MRFRLHGFHILEILNRNLKYIQQKPYQFYVIGEMVNDADGKKITLKAIIYDERRMEYQTFNLRNHILVMGSTINTLFDLFLEDIYMNMVMSVETDDSFIEPIFGNRLYSFRDIMVYIHKNDELPKPIKDVNDVRNYQGLSIDGITINPQEKSKEQPKDEPETPVRKIEKHYPQNHKGKHYLK